jgi:hypothetical protein
VTAARQVVRQSPAEAFALARADGLMCVTSEEIREHALSSGFFGRVADDLGARRIRNHEFYLYHCDGTESLEAALGAYGADVLAVLEQAHEEGRIPGREVWVLAGTVGAWCEVTPDE